MEPGSLTQGERDYLRAEQQHKREAYRATLTDAGRQASFWDVVVLTAADAAQAAHFERELHTLRAARRVPGGAVTSWSVVPDPPSCGRVGCGGSTLEVIRSLLSRFGDSLWSKRVLVLHSGGYSKRLPICTLTGKAFALVPSEAEDSERHSCCTLLEAKLMALVSVAASARPGFFVTCADVVEVFGSFVPDFSQPGFTAFAHPADPQVGLTHGVFVLDRQKSEHGDAASVGGSVPAKKFLHRPTLEEMKAEGALDPATGSILVDSSYFFDAELAKSLLALYEHNSPLTVEVDAYGDFLQPLGPCATSDYLTRTRNVAAASADGQLITVRRQLFDLLHGARLNVVPLLPSAFVHFGTYPEYLEHFCGGIQPLGYPRIVASVLVDGASVHESSCLMSSALRHPGVKVAATSALSYCSFFSAVSVGERCILSDVHVPEDYSGPSEIPSGVQMVTLALKSNGITGAGSNVPETLYATLCMGERDDLKGSGDKASICGVPLHQALQSLGLEDSNAWPAGSQKTSWDVKIWEAKNTAGEALASTLQTLHAVLAGRSRPVPVSGPRVSWDDVQNCKDLEGQMDLRKLAH